MVYYTIKSLLYNISVYNLRRHYMSMHVVCRTSYVVYYCMNNMYIVLFRYDKLYNTTKYFLLCILSIYYQYIFVIHVLSYISAWGQLRNDHTIYIVQCTAYARLYNVHCMPVCTMSIVHCTLYNVQCTRCIVINPVQLSDILICSTLTNLLTRLHHN